MRSQPRVLRRSSTKRREPVFTPLPSRNPTEAEDYNEGYIRVDSPDAVMRGALNARPGKMDPASMPSLGPALESPVLETLSERGHREHAERLHDVPRLLDRPPPLQHAGSFHSGRGERINPDGPIVMPHSPGRSSASGSDHTIEALRTPPLMHPGDRVIPPLPRNYYSGGHAPDSRSPTDIYGSYPYEVVHDARSHHNQEIYLDRHDRTGGYEKEGPIYYIIPGGMNVIFQDEHGNEITRVGDFSGRSRPLRPGPFVVQDEHGRELYRYDNHDRGTHQGYSEPQIVRIDTYPSSSQHRRDRNYSSHSHRHDPSYRRGYDYHPDHREYRDHRENDWRDHRDHRHRGYADYPNYSEHRDHRGDRDIGPYRDHGGYREHDGYREHGDYSHQGRSEMYTPGRVSSRASHRRHSHASQVSLERTPQQNSNSISDDRRSGRDYPASHSIHHQEDDADISSGFQALQL